MTQTVSISRRDLALSDDSQGVVLNGMHIDDEGVGLAPGGPYWVPRADVDRIVISRGALSAHPVSQFVVGSALSMVGLISLQFIVDWFRRGGIIFDVQVLLTLLLPLGGYLIYDCFRRGLYLVVYTTRGRRRFFFVRQPSLEQMKEFISIATDRFGYPVTMEN